MSELLLDAAGRRRSPATLPQFHAGRPPCNKGMRYPADPPTERARRVGDDVDGREVGRVHCVPQEGSTVVERVDVAPVERVGYPVTPRGRSGRAPRRPQTTVRD